MCVCGAYTVKVGCLNRERMHYVHVCEALLASDGKFGGLDGEGFITAAV